MRKHYQQNPSGNGALRGLAAVSLSCALAAFGCTTNRTPGNGQPSSTSPMTSPSAPASTPGTSSGTNPPMASSYVEPSSTLPAVRSLSRADAAAAIMASHQPPASATQMRYLGPANPALTGPELSSRQVTGQLIPPSLTANPQLTVNSSISSGPVEVVATGAGAGGGVGISAGTFATSAGAAQSVTIAPVVATSQALVTPTSMASQLTAGQFAAGPGATTGAATATGTTLLTQGAIIGNNNSGTLTPTLSSGATLTPTVVASGLTTTGTTATATTVTPTAATTNSTTATTAAATIRPTTTATGARTTVLNPVRLTTNANGGVVITNVRTIKGQ